MLGEKMTANNLARLICRVANGDNRALELLYLKTARGVYAFLYTYLHNHADTEDAMQTVYLKIKKGAGSFKAGTNGRAWILQIAKNHALDVLRQKRYDLPIESVANTCANNSFSDQTVMNAMQKVLTEEEQQIIALHVLWGYKHREIAQTLNVPTGTITSKYKRSIEKLKTALKGVDL
ncbi:MAG: sigma-70 family RNA polymerase sigma factor [Clostridiales bacterium]|nr:sigma-70 family RNA polymerase sigma factor [Clostridiales bacterium]